MLNTDHDAAAVRIRVRLLPRARGDAIVGRDDSTGESVLRVRVAAPPLDGRANAALVKRLSKALGAARRDVVVVQGERQRDKLVEVRGLSEEELRRRLASD
ncbi:MAG: hypothetical protein DK306_000402 [Chloroflexi bacterium]|jgi:uncharacterized protein (TIGR00251 family)|nr:MAG: hypothetical protein DK306_000402 [Chloroflexota bacterium]